MKFDPNGGLPDDSTREITPETQILATSWIGCWVASRFYP